MTSGALAFVSTMDLQPWGGSEELWSRSAALLRSQGVAVVANTAWWPEPARQVMDLQRCGVVLTVRKPQMRAARILQRVCRRDAYDWLDRYQSRLVVINQAGHMDGLGWMQACLARRLPYVTISQAAGENWWPDDKLATGLREAYNGAMANFFVSEGNRQLAMRQFADPLPKAEIVRNPFNVNYAAAPEWPSDADGYRIACVGRLEPRAKGQDLLFDLFSQDNWRRRDIELWLYGDGRNLDCLRRLKSMLALDRVHFAGVTHDVESIWAECHALILPSRFEGLPLVIVEAMLCGRPCIVTDVAGNAELMHDGLTGYVAAAPTVRCVDAALERAWADRTHWQEVGQRAAAAVRIAVPPDPTAVFAARLTALMGQVR